MKYVVSWCVRDGGSAQENAEGTAALLAAFGKWTPPASQTFHQFLTRLDGQGGYAVVETDDAASLLDAPSKFGAWLEFAIVPVVDIAEGVAILAEGVEFRNSVG